MHKNSSSWHPEKLPAVRVSFAKLGYGFYGDDIVISNYKQTVIELYDLGNKSQQRYIQQLKFKKNHADIYFISML